VCPPVLQETAEGFQEVRIPEQVPLAFPLFEKSSEISSDPESLRKIIFDALEELDGLAKKNSECGIETQAQHSQIISENAAQNMYKKGGY